MFQGLADATVPQADVPLSTVETQIFELFHLAGLAEEVGMFGEVEVGWVEVGLR